MKIKIGTRVKIINPEFLVRVGYPETVESARKKMEENFLEETGFSIDDILHENFNWMYENDHGYCRCIDQIKFALARDYNACVLNYGGTERQVFTRRIPKFQDVEFVINDFAVRKVTGEYQCGSGGSVDPWTGECDYEPPYLTNIKHHTFYRYSGGIFDMYDLDMYDSDNIDFYMGKLYIEKINLEVVK